VGGVWIFSGTMKNRCVRKKKTLFVFSEPVRGAIFSPSRVAPMFAAWRQVKMAQQSEQQPRHLLEEVWVLV